MVSHSALNGLWTACENPGPFLYAVHRRGIQRLNIEDRGYLKAPTRE